MTGNTRIITFVGITLAAALLPLLVAHATPLPPLPPPPPPSVPTCPPPKARSAPTSGRLELRVEFPEAISYQWQELWTVVQWQDEWGYWRDVEGWQGELDVIVTGEDGIVGQKVWWVAKPDLGKGPFRWPVYRGKGGRLLATSESFDLPAYDGATTTVEVSLR
jgi:hypothetical protein